MTHYEKLIVGIVLGQIKGLAPDKAAAHLLEQGLLNHRACEQRIVRAEIDRMARAGTLRGEAMHTVAETLCCSYEKVRGLYYNE